MDWLDDIATRLPVSYNKPQMPMGKIIGAVLHTTNHTAGDETLQRFQHNWQAAQNQSAHFVVDRNGNIGQYRSLSQVAWHIHSIVGSTQYVGIEHIAKPRQELTDDQVSASGKLVAKLSAQFGFSLFPIAKVGEPGVGIHSQFNNTGCGLGVFRSTSTISIFAPTFNAVLAGQRSVPCAQCNCFGWVDKDGDGLCDAQNPSGNTCGHVVIVHSPSL